MKNLKNFLVMIFSTLSIASISLAALMLSTSCSSNHDLVDTSEWASRQTCQFDPHCTLTSIHSHVIFE